MLSISLRTVIDVSRDHGVCAQWILRIITNEQENLRFMLYQQMGNHFLNACTTLSEFETKLDTNLTFPTKRKKYSSNNHTTRKPRHVTSS